jgi:hypothetical protein
MPEYLVPKTIIIPGELHKKILVYSQNNDIPVNAAVISLISAGLKRTKKPTK